LGTICALFLSGKESTANCQNEAQALALLGHETELHNYSLNFGFLE